MNRLLVPATVAAGLLSSPVAAWNDNGHMAVAAIAWAAMTPESQAAAAALLQLNPDYAHWVAGAPAAGRDRIAFMRAATWADDIKTDPDHVDDGFVPLGPATASHAGYADRLMHKYWHFKDIPFSTDGTPLREAPSPDAVSQIVALSASLANRREPPALRSYDLVWLIHLVGDIHQPLHATTRFTVSDPDGDAGGSDIRVCRSGLAVCDRDHSEDLHHFWDGPKPLPAGIDNATALAAAAPLPPAAAVLVSDPSEWAHESFMLSRDVAYAAPVGAGLGPYRLTLDYEHRAQAVAIARMALAGTRLAVLLNARLP